MQTGNRLKELLSVELLLFNVSLDKQANVKSGVEKKTYSFALCLHELIFPGIFTTYKILTESDFATSQQQQRQSKRDE